MALPLKTSRYTSVLAAFTLSISALTSLAAPADWQDDLQPIAAGDWTPQAASHLLERAGFGGTPAEVARLAAMAPRQAVQSLVRYGSIANPLPPFDPSGAHDAGLEPFATSRPAATEKARDTGEALGMKVKPDGNRRMQQVADRFFYIGCARAVWRRIAWATGGLTAC